MHFWNGSAQTAPTARGVTPGCTAIAGGARRAGRHLALPLHRRLPAKQAAVFGGSAYWCLSADCVHVIHEFVPRNPFVRFFRLADSPDEMFFQTILMNSRLRETVVDDLRYIHRSERRSHPALLTCADFGTLEDAPDLSARKLDVTVDSAILDLVDLHLLPR